mmetsp:Transcript_1277/g.3655  ORF Transcript_1277/g.3655 Transcript_1277/m.3655 type:complete len:348 (-) Transcript_1277:105-1148(-)
MVDGPHGANAGLVGAVDGHFQFPVQEAGADEVPGVHREGLVLRGGGGTGIAHAGTGHAGQDEGEGPVQDAGLLHLGRRSGDLAAEARSVEDVLDDAPHAAVGAALLDLGDQLLGFEVVAGVLDGADEGPGGMHPGASGFGALEGILQLAFVQLDGVLVAAGCSRRAIGVVRRGSGRRPAAARGVGRTVGIAVSSPLPPVPTLPLRPGTLAAKDLGSGVAVPHGLDGQVELPPAHAAGVGQEQDAVDAIAGRGALLAGLERHVLADAHLAQPLAGGEGAGIVPVAVGLGRHSWGRNSLKGEDDLRGRLAGGGLAQEDDRVAAQDVLDAGDAALGEGGTGGLGRLGHDR